MASTQSLFARLFLAGAPPAADVTDGRLPVDALTRRDPAAFEALVSRHGPTVWAVCRRQLRNPADAEDAFQATFLVLLRKGGSLTGVTSVGGWLYRVAFRTALKARTSASPPTIACPYTNASTCHAVRPQSSPPQAVISPSGPPTPRNTAPPSPPAMAACRSCWRLRRPVSTYCCTADPAASPAIPAGMPNGPASHPPTAAARAAWITEAKNDEERVRREQSDFLRYEDANEGKADFHSLRHKFIPELVKAGVQPQDAKELARHATISLTMDRYAHTTLTDTAAALSKMTGPIARPQVPPSVPIPDNGR